MIPVSSLGPRVLRGRFVQLEPLARDNAEELRAVAQDASIWRYMFMDGTGAGFDRWYADARKEITKGERIPFVVRKLGDNKVVGSTSYLAIVPEHARVEVGWTWYGADAQGSAVNPEAKLPLFANAFEGCGYMRVELKTDSTNARSRAAILKLWAKEECTLRRHMWMHRRYWRDTVYYSVLREEWPAVKAGLEARLAVFSR
jgi:RimJ/RimL family protein N-acetyltransferase